MSYLRRFDNDARILLGIFHRPSGTHVGLLTIHRTVSGNGAVINVLLGDPQFRSVMGLREFKELRTAVTSFLFLDKGYGSIVAAVLARNSTVAAYLERAGYQLVRRQVGATACKQTNIPLDILLYRLTREEWSRRISGMRSTFAGQHSTAGGR